MDSNALVKIFLSAHSAFPSQYYRVSHGFGHAKFAHGGSVSGLNQIKLRSQLPLKTINAQFKIGQNRLENNYLNLLT